MGDPPAPRLPALLLLTFLGASVAAFGIMYLAPMEPARFMLGFRQGVREDQILRLREWYGMDRPKAVQYLRWMGRVVRGDFGASLATRRDIAPEVARRIPWSALLIVPAALLAWGLAVPLAVVSAGQGALARAGRALTTLGLITPTFLVASLFVYLFAVRWSWVPILPPFDLNLLAPALWVGVLLPAVSLALPVAAVLAGEMRGRVEAALQAPFVTAARARGVPERRVVWRHAAGAGAAAVLAQPLPVIGLLVSGMLVVEEIFNWPGIGRVFMRAVAVRDVPVLQAILLVLAAGVLMLEGVIRAGGRQRMGHRATVPDGAAPTGRPEAVSAPGLHTRLAVALAGALVVGMVAAPVLVRFPPDQVHLDEIQLPPSARHWLGTDSSGRDLFSRLLYAGHVSLGISAAAAVAAVLASLLLSLHTSWRWPWRWSWDRQALVAWAARSLTAIPTLALAISAIAIAGRAPLQIAAVFTVLGIASTAGRISALQAAGRRWTFVEAAAVCGAAPSRVAERHLLPHLARPLGAAAASLVPGFLILEATLGFLGFSVTPTMPSWGTLLWRSREALHRGDWWLIVFPWLFVAGAAWAFGVLAAWLGAPGPPTYVRPAKRALGSEWGQAATARGRIVPVTSARPAVPAGRGPAPR
ncbi:MAG: ABC transporter permease subunit [Armatimonadota bacterium]|nr:ABC transporter permease subunit [Armatimonadota bacterium]